MSITVLGIGLPKGDVLLIRYVVSGSKAARGLPDRGFKIGSFSSKAFNDSGSSLVNAGS